MGTLQKSSYEEGTGSDQGSNVSEKELKTYRKNEKKLEKEYQKIRGELEDIRQAFRYLEDATLYDDIYFRLLQLEKITSQVRKGRLLSHGAKLHRKLLRKLSESPIE